MLDKYSPNYSILIPNIHVHTLHITDLPILSGFHTVAGNLHNIHPHQTAHPPICAKREKVKDFGYGDQPGSPSSRHPTTVPTSPGPEPSIS